MTIPTRAPAHFSCEAQKKSEIVQQWEEETMWTTVLCIVVVRFGAAHVVSVERTVDLL